MAELMIAAQEEDEQSIIGTVRSKAVKYFCAPLRRLLFFVATDLVFEAKFPVLCGRWWRTAPTQYTAFPVAAEQGQKAF